jgi:hypothetical protein
LTFHLLTGTNSSGISSIYLCMAKERGTQGEMADESEDPDRAADRLEAALERIAHLAAVRPLPSAAQALPPDSDLSIPEIAERLDQLISRLRAALGTPE